MMRWIVTIEYTGGHSEEMTVMANTPEMAIDVALLCRKSPAATGRISVVPVARGVAA